MIQSNRVVSKFKNLSRQKFGKSATKIFYCRSVEGILNVIIERLTIHFVIGSPAVFLLFTEGIEAEDKNIWSNFKILIQSELDFIVRLKER